MMPNTPALVGCGATVYARGKYAGDKEAEVAEKLFSAVGLCEEVSENLIDPVTALAGSGPAYVSELSNCIFLINDFRCNLCKRNRLFIRTIY